MIGLPALYTLAGLVFGSWAVATLLDRQHTKRLLGACFWGLLAVEFLAGDALGDTCNGLLLLLLVALALLGAPGKGQAATTTIAERLASVSRHGNRLFLPALIMPGVALAGTFIFPLLPGLVDPKQVTLISLGLGALIATSVLMLWLRPPLVAPMQEGRRLAEGVGWAMILPQLLASLGALFTVAGVGEIVGALAPMAIPEGSRLAAVLAFTAGMAIFTIMMGNAFAAFPVIMGGIGLPVLVLGLGGDPVVVGAVGMLA
ncbi:MAG: DUF979 family protein, partial [Rhodospirillales bacterium]|nr:DUF979 family protein [Rhodospirillales bacterium]